MITKEDIHELDRKSQEYMKRKCISEVSQIWADYIKSDEFKGDHFDKGIAKLLGLVTKRLENIEIN